MHEVKEVGSVELKYEGKTYTYPVFEGSEGERAVQLGNLRKDTKLIGYDPGYGNTGSCISDITFIDGEKGILRYRGYPIDELANNCTFIEVAYLLVHGRLPNQSQLSNFSRILNRKSLIHEDMRNFFRNYPEHAHPMAILSAMVVSLSSFYRELGMPIEEEIDLTVARLLSKIRTLAALSYKQSIGQPHVYPSSKLTYVENFLNMMFYTPVANYEIDPITVRALNKLLILHADHEQNCSTSAVRLVGSSGANLYASISAGICALWGPLHGGANQAVIEMLEQIKREGLTIDKCIERAKDKNDPFRLMGFGHRVYKSYDPRAKIAKKACEDVLNKLGIKDELLDIAVQLEDRALNDDYFKERNLYPNVDYYTGITLRAMGIPTNMFTVIFAIGRLPGWIAHWLEQRDDKDQRIGRPRQIYTGPQQRGIVPIEERP
jgi:citrate synthase